MTARRLPLLAPILIIVACGDGAANTQQAGPRPLDNTQNSVLALPEPLREGVLIRAIVDAREQCSHVERSENLGVVNGMPTFVAYCDTDRVFTVAIQPGGRAVVARGVPAR